MDIVFFEIAALLLGLVFAHALVTKLRSPRAFVVALEGYRLIPTALLAVAGGVVIICELTATAALVSLVIDIQRAGLILAACLLAVYGLAMAINLMRGRRDIDCGCTGPARRSPISWPMVWRNVVLASVALLIVASGVDDRMLTALDFITIVGGLGSMLLAYAAMNEALRTPGRFGRLARH